MDKKGGYKYRMRGGESGYEEIFEKIDYNFECMENISDLANNNNSAEEKQTKHFK